MPALTRQTRRMPRLTEADEKRFWAKVALPDKQGCMLWSGKPDGNGYGNLHLQGWTVRAHQVAYLLAHGPVSDGLVIDHVKANGCTNRHCVAPLHLEAVTQAENVRRAMKTRCKRGHQLAGANLYFRPDTGVRQCRACRAGRRRGKGSALRASASPSRRHMQHEFLTAQEVSGILRVSLPVVYRMIQSGRLQAIQPGRSYRIPRSSLDAWMTAQTQEATG